MKKLINRKASKKVSSNYKRNQVPTPMLSRIVTRGNRMDNHNLPKNDINELHECETALLKIKGVTAACILFECSHNNDIVQDCRERGYTVFHIRHEESNWADPRFIEKSVVANFWGYIAIKDESAIELLKDKLYNDGFLQVNSNMLKRLGIYDKDAV